MGLADLFKSTKEIEKEKRRAQRAMERQVENAIDRNADRIKELEKERAKNWEKARILVASGQRTEAARLVQIYKAQGLQISKLERQKTYAQNKLNEIAGASDMKNVAQALKDLVKVTNLDPDEFAENLDVVEEVSADTREMNKIMDKASNKDQERMIAEAETEKENSIEDDELMAALESEAAVGVLGDKVTDLSGSNKEVTVSDINAGRDRLNALLEKK